MQQIERYGVIVLVFLLVTIVAVSFWGDGKSPGFWSRLTGKAKKEEVAKVELPPPAPVMTAENALVGGAPLNPVVVQDPLMAAPPVIDAAVGQPGAEPTSMLAAGGQTTPVSFGTPAQGGATPPVNAPQPAFTPAPVVPAPTAREYTVQKGDSLALIARRALGSEQRWTEIQALNPGVTPKSLKIGMKLQMPDGALLAVVQSKSAPRETKPAPKSTSNSAAVAKSPESKSGARYTIQRGDTLNAIAEKKLGSKTRVKDILALNPGLDPKKLVVGKSIALPAGTSAQKAPLVASAVSASNRSDRPRVR